MRNPFKKKEANTSVKYDPSIYTPVIRASVCTGEKVAGFRDRDGKIHEIMLIQNEHDLRDFRRQFGISGEIEKVY